jgi:hypothetical protein
MTMIFATIGLIAHNFLKVLLPEYHSSNLAYTAFAMLSKDGK